MILRRLTRPYVTPDLNARGSARYLQVVGRLKIHPELRRAAEVARQPQRRHDVVGPMTMEMDGAPFLQTFDERFQGDVGDESEATMTVITGGEQ